MAEADLCKRLLCKRRCDDRNEQCKFEGLPVVYSPLYFFAPIGVPTRRVEDWMPGIAFWQLYSIRILDSIRVNNGPGHRDRD